MKIEDVKIGMKVRVLPSARTGATRDQFGFPESHMGNLIDTLQLVDGIGTFGGVCVGGYIFHPDDLELVVETQPEPTYPNPPHKHKDIIIAWANGAEVQTKDGDEIWTDIVAPCWYEHHQYRIKPAQSKEPPKPEWIKVD